MIEPGTYLSTNNVPVFVEFAMEPEGLCQEIGIHYGKGGKTKSCWWPNVPRCQPQAQEVFTRFMADCDSLGVPIRELSQARREANVARLQQHREAARISPGENLDSTGGQSSQD